MTKHVWRYALICGVFLISFSLKSCGGGDNNAPPPNPSPLPPVMGTLTVTVTGDGLGTISSSPPGIDACAATCSAQFSSGTVVDLSASVQVDSTFMGWTDACTGTGTCQVTIDGTIQSVAAADNSKKTVGAGFKKKVSPTLTVTVTNGTYGTVTSSPAGISDCTTTCTTSFPSGTIITLTASPKTDATFQGWSGICSGTQSTCTFTITDNLSVNAGFNAPPPPPPVYYSLTVNRTGTGTGTIADNATLSCSLTSCSVNYIAGTKIVLTATPTNGSTFAGWSGVCSGQSSCTVTMNSNLTATAQFIAPIVSYALTVTKTGTGVGSISTADNLIKGCTTSCTLSYQQGSVVSILPQYDTSTTKFLGWSGACSGIASCTVTMNSALTVSAQFVPYNPVGCTLTWYAPTLLSDGTYKEKGYWIYTGTSSKVYPQKFQVTIGPPSIFTNTQTIQLPNYPWITGITCDMMGIPRDQLIHYFAITAYNYYGESDYSNEASAKIY